MDIAIKNKPLREILAWITFPVIFYGSLFAAYMLLYVYQKPILYTIFIVATGFVLIAICERINPYRKQWNVSENDVFTDILYLISRQILDKLWIYIANISLIVLLSFSFFTDTIFSNIWPSEAPFIVQFLLLCVVREFYSYWEHRLHHKIPALWRLHAVHHSPKRLYFLNAARFHVVEMFITYVPLTIILFSLGVDEKLLALIAVFTSIHGLFQHSNIHVKLGFQNYIYSMTELHRWHHSKLIQESDRNFGSNLIFWDLVFGTFYWPREREVATIGVMNPKYPENFIGQLTAPFKKEAIDKPKGYSENPLKFEEQIREDNKALSKKLGIKN